MYCLSGQSIKISGPQFWKDKKLFHVGIWNKKWCWLYSGCPQRVVAPRYCLTGQLSAEIFLHSDWNIFYKILAAGEVSCSIEIFCACSCDILDPVKFTTTLYRLKCYILQSLENGKNNVFFAFVHNFVPPVHKLDMV